jgi:hypothetical protein
MIDRIRTAETVAVLVGLLTVALAIYLWLRS